RRSRTRLPCRTISGVVAGAERPLNVSQLNSMAAVFGTEFPGSTAHSCSLMHREFVDERSSGRHGFLADPGHAVLFDRNFQTVPVQGSAFRQCVFKHNANTVAARDLDGWAGTTAVVAPHVDGLERRDLPFERRGLEAKDLYAGVELKGQLRNIRSHHRNWREWGFGRATRYPRGR